jgi:hypothetical protein
MRFSANTSPGELAVIAAALLLVCIVGAVIARRRAPVVSLALIAAVIAGVIGFFPSSLDGPERVPQDVVVWASCALALFGLVGLLFLPGRGAPPPTWRAVVAVVVCAPLLATVVHLAITDACPLYVGRGSGYCRYTVDLMGGWATTVSALVALDTVCVAFLLGVTGWQARRERRLIDMSRRR